MSVCDLIRKWLSEAHEHRHPHLASALETMLHVFGCHDIAAEVDSGDNGPPPTL